MAKNYILAKRIEERNNMAKEAELDGDVEKAIRFYEHNIKEDYADEFAFERLMIIYRKLKEYKEELRVIDRGIDVFESQMQEHLAYSLSKRADQKTLATLSNALIKKAKLEDDIRYPDPIDKWLKRKEIVKKKLE
jgi:hypothetical protein